MSWFSSIPIPIIFLQSFPNSEPQNTGGSQLPFTPQLSYWAPYAPMQGFISLQLGFLQSQTLRVKNKSVCKFWMYVFDYLYRKLDHPLCMYNKSVHWYIISLPSADFST